MTLDWTSAWWCLALLLVTAFAPAAAASAATAAEPPFTYGPWHHSAIGGGGYVQNVVLERWGRYLMALG
jgi:Spy/CpxP family protein refolding chaperone